MRERSRVGEGPRPPPSPPGARVGGREACKKTAQDRVQWQSLVCEATVASGKLPVMGVAASWPPPKRRSFAPNSTGEAGRGGGKEEMVAGTVPSRLTWRVLTLQMNRGASTTCSGDGPSL